MATGTVKWFNPTKGYGFIEPEGGDKDVFVHISAVQAAGMKTLEPDQKVEYELEDGKDGKVSAGNLKAVFTAKTNYNILRIYLKFTFTLNFIFFSKINVISISSF